MMQTQASSKILQFKPYNACTRTVFQAPKPRTSAAHSKAPTLLLFGRAGIRVLDLSRGSAENVVVLSVEASYLNFQGSSSP